MDTFQKRLLKHNIRLSRDQTTTLQINTGLLCNQTCRHCHLDAGPGRRENMDRETADALVAYAERAGFAIADITGGAPELNPHLEYLIERLVQQAPRVMLRSNLTAIGKGKRDPLIRLLTANRVVIVASFPSLNKNQTDSQRGDGIFETSIETLKKLNAHGYGQEKSGLELNLVSNPTGAFLPPSQGQTEKRFRNVLKQKTGIVFNNLYNFANVPLGRFKDWLTTSGNLDAYMNKLAAAFNPCALDGVMCRALVSVSWDGYLYDCDFNLANGLPMTGRKIHVSDMPGISEPGSAIMTGDHCYTCTAGAGFT